MEKIENKLIVLALMLVVALLGLSGCQNNNNNNTNNTGENSDELKGLTVYTAENKEGYTEYSGSIDAKFSYPTNWISVGKDEQPVFMSSDGKGKSVNVSYADYPEAMSFEGFIEASKLGIKNQMTIIGDINHEMINLNGRKACRLDYVAQQSETVNVNIIQAVFVDGGKVYILTVAANSDYYEEAKPELDTIIKSFTK